MSWVFDRQTMVLARLSVLLLPHLAVVEAVRQFLDAAAAVLATTRDSLYLTAMADSVLAFTLGVVTLCVYCLVMVVLGTSVLHSLTRDTVETTKPPDNPGDGGGATLASRVRHRPIMEQQQEEIEMPWAFAVTA